MTYEERGQGPTDSAPRDPTVGFDDRTMTPRLRWIS